MQQIYSIIYYVLQDESIVITGYFGSDREVTVPSLIAGYPVSVIGKGAFSESGTVKKINLPDESEEEEREGIQAGDDSITSRKGENNQLFEDETDRNKQVSDEKNNNTNKKEHDDTIIIVITVIAALFGIICVTAIVIGKKKRERK